MNKQQIRMLIVKLVMDGWTSKLENKYASKFKKFVLDNHPDAKVEQRGQGFSLVGVEHVKCHHSTVNGVWALAAKELAR